MLKIESLCDICGRSNIAALNWDKHQSGVVDLVFRRLGEDIDLCAECSKIISLIIDNEFRGNKYKLERFLRKTAEKKNACAEIE